MAIITTASDTSVGRRILGYFHNSSVKYSNYKFKTLDELINYYGAKGPILVNGTGKTFRISGAPEYKAQEAMLKLAMMAQGKIPTWQAYGEALTKNLTASVWDITSGSFADVGRGVVKTGETAIATGKNLQTVIKILPYVLLGLGVYIVATRGKAYKERVTQSLGGKIQDFKKKTKEYLRKKLEESKA